MSNARSILLSKRIRQSLESAVSTGSTLLNLACTDHPNRGFAKGGYYYLVGDSTSGKTWLSLTCFAEACRTGQFKEHRLIFDDVEGGALMDWELYFGAEVARRAEPPSIKNGQPVMSSTVESFYYHITDAIEAGKPFIYVLDSQDSLTSAAADAKFEEQKKASRDGKDAAGSYGDGKAKYHSEHIRIVKAGLMQTGSILIIIGQTRDNLGDGFAKKTRAGGKALRFYADIEIWTSVKGKLKRTIRGKDRTVGIECLAEVRKNRVTGKVGKDRAVVIPIYNGLGIDDIGSCVDYLIEEGHWPKAVKDGKPMKSVYDATDLFFQGTRDRIIAHIEAEDLEIKVRKLVGHVWQEIEAECAIPRKRRYE